ncbi:hypothetical protein BS50DRAFT_485608 [Corynespora cassiicola Philippines]|uniref:Mediator of RNA polymerase II transcription subunit 21 n=1 Tax=Corynespora cassiicola Philippines TaxID=1448308 RepID=A0A2T2NZ81_CORCC|nr:hypothetical protein BS50DRAFT_485608 [Corynespora cassiicola Philippines]
MADILTQIQDELDMLLNQMQSSLAYIKNRAPPANIAGQPLLSSFAEYEAQATQTTQSDPSQQQPPPPPSQDEFLADIKTLSKDLVLKEQQIEYLIAHLPGLKSSEKEQVDRMKELERQLEEVEEERKEAAKERDLLVRKVEDKIIGVGSVG